MSDVTWQRVNVNDQIKVRLTGLGRWRIREEFESLRRIAPRTPEWAGPQEDAEGFVTMLLWEFMIFFGPVIHMGGPNYFEMVIKVAVKPDAGT